MSEITGRTRLLGILADPVIHVKAPPRINALARARGVDAVMVPFHVSPAELAGVVASLRHMRNFDGAIVTLPHKTAIVALCDRVSRQAQAVGACNVIRREADGSLVGDVLDGIGFVAGLTQAGITVAGRHIYLAGAGGAANAIAFALVEAGAARLTIANRTAVRALDLQARLKTVHTRASVVIGTRDPSGHELIVNGTSLGMKPGDPLPLDVEHLTAGMTVAEVIMEPEETPLLLAAKAAGARIHLGKPMLTCQLELMADFFGVRAA